MAQSTALIAFCVCIVINCAFGDDIITAKPVPTQSYRHSLSLDEMENYYLYWTFDEDYITFEVHAKTRGWVGFGMSSTGGMKGADIVVGWVKGGKAQIHDLHAVGQERPLVDDKQNYELLEGKETSLFTVLKFRRELDTCDDLEDYNIEGGTIRMIFAWGQEDPDSITELQYHGSEQRGTRSLMLLDFGKPEHTVTESYDQMPYFDLVINNATLQENRTTYFCRIAALPDLPTKKHVVKVSPLIEKKNIAVVHHIVVYECHGNLKEDSEGQICWEGRMPDNATVCDAMMFGWAVGQGDFHYPKDVGYPFGAKNQAKFIQLEMHYDNPNHIKGIVDNSGLRFYYTEPRKLEAGTMVIGHTVWWPPLSIPPNMQKFQIDTYCNRECTGMGLPESGIRVFATLLHTHLVGNSIWMKHLRNGQELPEIAREDHYDFDYQQLRVFKHHAHIQPRDELLTSCTYTTKGKRNKMTYGGPGTDNEMCIAFLLYYPRVELQSCLSSVQAYYPIHQWVMQKAMTGEIEIDPKNEDKNVYDYLDEFEWTDEDREAFQKKVQQAHGYTQTCALRKSEQGLFGGTKSKYYKKIEIEKPYYKERKCKKPEASSSPALSTLYWLVLSTATACLILNIEL